MKNLSEKKVWDGKVQVVERLKKALWLEDICAMPLPRDRPEFPCTKRKGERSWTLSVSKKA